MTRPAITPGPGGGNRLLRPRPTRGLEPQPAQVGRGRAISDLPGWTAPDPLTTGRRSRRDGDIRHAWQGALRVGAPGDHCDRWPRRSSCHRAPGDRVDRSRAIWLTPCCRMTAGRRADGWSAHKVHTRGSVGNRGPCRHQGALSAPGAPAGTSGPLRPRTPVTGR
jgi:hypothetical protein